MHPLALVLLFGPLAVCAQVPEISRVSPSSGQPGDLVVLEGQDFDRNPTNNSVFFGNIKARVIAASVTEMRVEVPRGVQGGSIMVSAGGLSALSPTPFLPTFPPYGKTNYPPYVLRQAFFQTNLFLPLFAAADFDGDGAAEVILATADRRVHIHQYQGGRHLITTNSFRKIATLFSGTTPNQLFVMDYDGDGRLDLVTGSPTGFMIYKNLHTTGALTGNSFAAPMNQGRAMNSRIPALVADLDRDGRMDIVTLETGSIHIHKNTHDSSAAAGGRILALPLRMAVSPSAETLVVGDLNRDGHMEMVIGGPRLTIYSHHDRSGVLSTNSFAQIFLPLTNMSSVSLADVEGDGWLDIVAAPIRATETSVLWNRSFGGHLASNLFPRVRISDRTLSASFGGLLDYNGDARPDLPGGFGPHQYYPNLTAAAPGIITGDSFASVPATYAFRPPSQFSAADVNGDGVPDIILRPTGNIITILQNIGATPAGIDGIQMTNRLLRLQAYGFPNQLIPSEASSDLRVWVRHQSFRTADNGEATLTTAPSLNRRFFRVLNPFTNQPAALRAE